MITKIFGEAIIYRWTGVGFIFCLMVFLALQRAEAANPLDGSFGSGGKVLYEIGVFTTTTEDVAIQPDGKIVIVGHARGSDPSVFTVTRYNADGSPDASFSGDGRVSGAFTDYIASEAYAVAIQPDGKIVLAGKAFLNAFPYQAFGVARLNPDGSYDTSFDGDGRAIFSIATQGDAARKIAIQPSGKILVAGDVYYNNPTTGPANTCTIRLNANGSLDTTFAVGGYAFADGYAFPTALMVEPDGKFYMVAGTSNANGYALALILRYNADGSPDTTFNGSGKLVTQLTDSSSAGPSAAALQPDGKFIIGTSQLVGGNEDYDFVVIRFNRDGSRDASFDGDGTTAVSFGNWQDALLDMAIQPDGKIVAAGGKFNGQANSSSTQDFAMARLNADGSLDNTFGIGGKIVTPVGTGNDCARAVAVQANGKIVLAGIAFAAPFGNTWRGALVGYMGDVNAADFDGDTKTDVSIFRPSDGDWWLLKSSNGGNAAFRFGNSADKLVPGDYTGDGKTDIAAFRPSTGEWFVLRSENVSYYSFPFGISGDVPAPADFDGDGKTDAAVFRPSNQTWYIMQSSGGTILRQFGAADDVPAVSDYDGDGRSDIAIYRPNLGQWWIQRSSNNSVYAFQFGTSSDKAAPGDYTGDGKTDAAFFRPATGEWFILRSENNSYYSLPFGAAGDVPAPGDYDGDGRFDTAVFRPSTDTWFIKQSTQATLIIKFGANGDVPVPSSFVY